MCCWEWKPRYFCTWCRVPLFWHPRPGRLEPCLSSRITGGRVAARCVEERVNPIESEAIYTGCCADCARLVARGQAPTHYTDDDAAAAAGFKPPAAGRRERRRASREDKRVGRGEDKRAGRGEGKRVGRDSKRSVERRLEKWVGCDGSEKKKDVKPRRLCAIL